ncbi:MAG: hypothetical protein ACK2UQ_01825, partial [Anaerolineae bacterium]
MNEKNATQKAPQNAVHKEQSSGRWRALLTPLMAIVTALILGAIVIVVTDTSVYDAFREGFGAG